MSIDGLIIFYIIFGFFALCMLLAVGVMFHFYRRRKLIFTNFLNANGQWERKEWKPDKIDKNFEHDGETYKFDIKLCTRDFLNRPIAHYFKGNPNQQVFNVEHGNKHIMIGTHEITLKDFRQLMLSKVLKDIFSDDDTSIWFIVMIAVMVVGFVIMGIMIYTHNPQVILATKDNNQTIEVIAQGVRVALQR